MPWKISGQHVINADTGREVNKKPLPLERLKRLLKAMWANATTEKAEQPRDKNGRWAKLGGAITTALINRGKEKIQEAANTRHYTGYKKYVAKVTRPSRLFKKSDRSRKLEDVADKIGRASTRALDTSHIASGINRSSKISRNLERIMGRLQGALKEWKTSQPRWPKGTPLGGQWKDDGTASVNDAIGAINKVHQSDGPKPQIVTNARFSGQIEAGYTRDGRVHVNKATDSFTATHEIGHYLADKIYKDFDAKGRLKQVSNAINSTPSTKAWDNAKINGVVHLGDKRITVGRRAVAYFTQGREKWARAYAQYIAIKSKNPKLLKGLRQRQSGLLPTQWSDKEFKPIYNAMDEVFG